MAKLFENIWGWFVVRPDRITPAGAICSSAGLALLIAGCWGAVASAALDALGRMRNKPFDGSLATLLGGFSTWWIPESALGFIFALILIVGGICFAALGANIKRLLRC